MGDLQTNADLLVGKQIERIHIVDSERVRQADKYLIVECADGTRLILAHVENLPRPAPNSLLALREAAKEHGAFTVQEALILAEGKALGPAPNTQSHVEPKNVDVDDARGLTQAEEEVDVTLSAVSSATDRQALEAAKDEATEKIENLPQDRRGRWYDDLGQAYKTSLKRIKREEKR